MTLLNYLQNHSLEEILEDDKLIGFIWALIFSSDNYVFTWGDNGVDGESNVCVCINHNCEFWRFDDYDDQHECIVGNKGLKCPYKDEHWKSIKDDVKALLLKELGD